VAYFAGSISATTAAAFLCVVPPGSCVVTVTNDSASAGSAFVGPQAAGSTTAAISSSSGIPVPAGQSLVFAGYPSSTGAQFAVVAASTATVGWLISTDQ
jgi:hypothetical protein